MKKTISILTPTFNEEKNVKKLCDEIKKIMHKLDYNYEHILIDNNSKDKTREIIKDQAKECKNIKAIFNSKNFGHTRSPYYGMLQCKGDAIILMASDFQDPIELIPDLISKWENGSKVVMLQKNSSQENFFVKFIRVFYYFFINCISETMLPVNTTGSGLYDSEIINNLKKIDEKNPYFRGLITEVTDNINLLKYDQPRRKFGLSKNNFYTLYDLAMLGVVKHSKKILRFFSFVGFASSIGSVIIAIFFLFYKLFFWDNFQLGTALIILGIFFGFSLQFIIIGLIGEYIMSIHTEVRKIPLVIEEERINFE